MRQYFIKALCVALVIAPAATAAPAAPQPRPLFSEDFGAPWRRGRFIVT